jgi:PAS domain S-box-containing protein
VGYDAAMARPEEPPASALSTPSGGETRFRDLLDRLPQTVFEFDLEGRFVYVNRTGLERFGYTESELAQGLSVLNMVLPEERETLRANIVRRLGGGEPEGVQYAALRKDGSTFQALVDTVVVNKNGRPCGIQGYLIDVSERVRAEDALRRRVALEQLIMRASTRLVAELAPSELDTRIREALAEIGRFLDADRSYVFLLSPDGVFADNTHEWVADGITAEQSNLQHIPVETAFPWFMSELRQRFVVPVAKVDDLPPQASAEKAELARQGIRSLICVAMIHAGTLSGLLGLDAVRSQRSWSEDEIALLRVMGEIFMGAIARQRAEQALQESERKYKTLVETTATGFVILDDQGHVLDANAEYVRMSGHRALQEIRGRAVTEWTASHDQARNAKALDDCMQCGYVRDLQIDYAHADGTLLPVLINATVTEVDGGRRVITLIRDVSDRKRLEAEILRSEKLRSVGVLAGGIAHDFNNILTAILGNISLLRATLAIDDAAGEHLDEVEKASQRARELTRQLLTFSRGGDPVRKPFQPEPLIRESTTLALRGRASACEFKIAPGLAPVDGDEGQIGQVLRNLVINASQAMSGGGTVVVSADSRRVRDGEVHTLAAGNYVVVAISDSGVGISEEHRLRIFDPYFTTKRDGRGLGLAVSHSVVANHHGAITVASQVGQGSVFTVYLPAADDSALVPHAAMAEIVHGRGRVLIMDDEESVRQIAGKIVRALGYEAAFARDGREAIECWRRASATGQPFDVAIMDLTVPGGMGGREAMRELLALDPEAKAVVSSGYCRDPVMANFRDYGFRDVLAKPYSVLDVSRALSALLRR